MTAKELYTNTRMIMFDNLSSKKLDQYYLAGINVLLAELFAENNSLREGHNKEPLLEIPQVSDGQDELNYEPEMLYMVMPKGLAAHFYVDEDDRSKYTLMKTEYMNARAQVSPIVYVEGWS